MVRFAKFAPVFGAWWVLFCWRGSYRRRFFAESSRLRGKFLVFLCAKCLTVASFHPNQYAKKGPYGSHFSLVEIGYSRRFSFNGSASSATLFLYWFRRGII